MRGCTGQIAIFFKCIIWAENDNFLKINFIQNSSVTKNTSCTCFLLKLWFSNFHQIQPTHDLCFRSKNVKLFIFRYFRLLLFKHRNISVFSMVSEYQIGPLHIPTYTHSFDIFENCGWWWGDDVGSSLAIIQTRRDVHVNV